MSDSRNRRGRWLTKRRHEHVVSPAWREPQARPKAPLPPVPDGFGPGVDEMMAAGERALIEPGGYVVDLFGMFRERDRNDLEEL